MDRRTYQTGLMIHALHRAHRTAVQGELAALGLDGMGSPMILMLLKRRGPEGGGAYQRELADALHISPAAIAMALKSLEREGYVARRGDPGDQRRKRIAITDKGMAAVDQCWSVMQQVDGTMLEGLSVPELDALHALHLRMLQNLYAGGSPPEDPFERMGCNCSKP